MNKLMTAMATFIAMLMVSCGTLTPEAKLQVAQKSLMASVEMLHEARDAGELEGPRLAKAQKIVKKIHSYIKTWRHSILTDKENGIDVQHRADLNMIVTESIKQLGQFHLKKPKKKDDDEEED